LRAGAHAGTPRFGSAQGRGCGLGAEAPVVERIVLTSPVDGETGRAPARGRAVLWAVTGMVALVLVLAATAGRSPQRTVEPNAPAHAARVVPPLLEPSLDHAVMAAQGSTPTLWRHRRTIRRSLRRHRSVAAEGAGNASRAKRERLGGVAPAVERQVGG
jgi:hypothetical protein